MAPYQCPEEWEQWVQWLSAGLHGRNRWRLPIIMAGMLFATGRRTVTSWLRAAGVTVGFQGYYYFISALGRKSTEVAERLLVLVLRCLGLGDRVLLGVDDTPTKRYGPHVQGAGKHHNPTPGPADASFLYGHVWVTISLLVRHACWGVIGLPLLGMLYVRSKDVCKIPRRYGWQFATKLELAARGVQRLAELLCRAGKQVWVVADGAYAKRPFLRPLLAAGAVVVSRLRKDAALWDLPPQPRRGRRRKRGRPRKYGRRRISLRKRAGQRRGWQQVSCVLYGEAVSKRVKTFLATYRPVGGVIRVVIVDEGDRFEYFFCTEPTATVREILESMAARGAVEQNYHDVKEVWGSGQQQVRVVWSNVGVFNLNLWMHTLVELWAWHKGGRELVNRSDSPWDDASRRPSHADRRKALQGECLRREFLSLRLPAPIKRKIRSLLRRLTRIAA